MSEQWTLNITVKSEIEVPADARPLLIDWYGGKRKANTALRGAAFASLNWQEIETDLKARIDDRNKLTTIRELRAHVAQGDKLRGKITEDVAAKISDLTGRDVDWIQQQLARLDEEDATE
jgi:hypothetical protein